MHMVFFKRLEKSSCQSDHFCESYTKKRKSPYCHFGTPNLLEPTYIVHFWSDLGKIKPKNLENTSEYIQKGLSRWSTLVLTLLIVYPGLFRDAYARMPTRRYSVILNNLSSRIDPHSRERPFNHSLMCFHHIWDSFFSEPTRNPLFTYLESFEKKWLKSAFLVGFGQNKAQKSRKHAKIYPWESFSGVWVHLGWKLGFGA